jgi:hypothetical protein
VQINNFEVIFPPGANSKLKANLFGATVLLDQMFFENANFSRYALRQREHLCKLRSMKGLFVQEVTAPVNLMHLQPLQNQSQGQQQLQGYGVPQQVPQQGYPQQGHPPQGYPPQGSAAPQFGGNVAIAVVRKKF